MTNPNSPSAEPSLTPSRRPANATLFLLVVLSAVALYLPSLHAEFLILDDPQYTTGNPYILYPSGGKLVAFFTEVWKPSVVAGYYQPLTMASLMLDRVIGAHLAGAFTSRIDPTIFHLTNVLLHALCAGLVFVVILRITGARWIAFFCAMLFAVHPLNVEVVAWVSQRKALLSTCFALLMLLAYFQYAATRRRVWLFFTTFAFVLSMLAKPTGVLLPLVLLVFDVWPLRRWSRQSIVEKWPLFVFAAVGGGIAYVSQTSTVDLTDAGQHRGIRMTALIAAHNLVFYLAKIVAPVRLCPNYLLPPESHISLTARPFAVGVIGAGVLLFGTYRAYRRRDNADWTMAAAFVLLIAPTLGPVRFTNTIAADRFMYLPMIAVLILIAEHTRRAGSLVRQFLICFCAAAIIFFTIRTFRYQRVWHDSIACFSAVADRYPQSPDGHYGLANAFLNQYEGSSSTEDSVDPAVRRSWLDVAAASYEIAISLDPANSNAFYRLGHVLITQGHTREGIETIQKGMGQPYAHPDGHFFLGLAYTHVGDDAAAIPHYEECIQRRPASIEARLNLANALLRTGRAAEAIPHYERLLELSPFDLDGQQNWAVALLTVGDAPSAIDRLQRVIAIRASLADQLTGARQESQSSSLADARYTLAGALAMTGDADGAIRNLRLAISVKPELLKQAESNRAFASIIDTAPWRALRESVPRR